MYLKKESVIRISLFCWCCPANLLKKLKLKSLFSSLAITRVCQQGYVIIADSDISIKLKNAMWKLGNHFHKFYKDIRTNTLFKCRYFTTNYF